MEAASQPRSCRTCGASLGPANPRRRFCSNRCRQAAHRRRTREDRDVAAATPFEVEDRRRQLEPPALLDDDRFEGALLAVIAKAGGRDWRAAAWVLERRWPERWGRPGERETRPPLLPDDPFAEVDQLAERRRRRTVD